MESIDTHYAEPSEEPSQSAPLFDLANTPIPSFTQLQHFRQAVFTSRKELDSFRNTVVALEGDGEAGRRRGLGLWMVGHYKEADQILAKYENDDVASFTRGHAKMSIGDAKGAAEIFGRLTQSYPDLDPPRGCLIEAQFECDIESGDEASAVEKLRTALSGTPESFKTSSEYHYLCGRGSEATREYQDALDSYEAAYTANAQNRPNLFRLAHLCERFGLEAEALRYYEQLVKLLPIDKNVLMNLGVLYEDLGRDQDAAACFDTVVGSFPTDSRARLFLEDARQGMTMYYDEDMERKEDRLNQILRIPITDFELSVRARNCLNKMDINTLGDLVRKTEAELLSYKNFGETSLKEIKEILGSKGLRLGMAREEAVASIETARTRYSGMENAEMLNKPVLELELSIRARRTVETLGCLTVGDVIQHSEEELLGMPNFGVTSLVELKQKLTEMNLKLKPKR